MPALRTFQKYAQTAGVNVFPYPCNLVDFDGNLTTGVAGLFLQFHDKATAPSAADVPLKSFLIVNAGPTPLASIFQALGPITFKLGLSFGISSTDATYTAATATYDVEGEIEEGLESSDAIPGLTVSTVFSGDDQANIIDGSNATLRNTRLFRVDLTNNESATRYFVFMGISTGAPGSLNPNTPALPFQFVIQVPNDNVAHSYYFGSSGYRVHGLKQSTNADIWGLACQVATKVGPWVSTDLSGESGCTLVAYYKSVTNY